MVLQLTLIFGFQILAGFVYTEIAIIVSCFMVGIALGSALFDRCVGRIGQPRFWLAAVQVALMLHLAGSLSLLVHFHSSRATVDTPSLSVAFPLLALLAGALGGLHYALAVHNCSAESSAAPGAWIGGGLYALDLLGAAAGAITASLILLPVFGLVSTCLIALALLAGSLGILILI
jgi:spermidine synthase